jgi:hypothetical protein
MSRSKIKKTSLQICSEAFLAGQVWDLGGLMMRPIVEMIEPLESPAEMFPSVSSADFTKHQHWMVPDYY